MALIRPALEAPAQTFLLPQPTPVVRVPLARPSHINRRECVTVRAGVEPRRGGGAPKARTALNAVSTDAGSAASPAANAGVASPKTAFNVLITGSTKGVGYALAREFLLAGDNVLITSRKGEKVQEAASSLQDEFGHGRVWGTPCDVSDPQSVAALAEFAIESLGTVDVWINNAGTNAYYYGPIIDCSEEDLKEIVSTNLLGIMLCCRQAIKLMKEQASGGHIFNMDGAGADGSPTPRFAAYGATKRSLAQFTKSLQAELKMLKVSNVTVHNLSPGMVTTELLMSGANTPTAKFFINALAEPADEVSKFLVPRVREVAGSPSPGSSYIRFLTRPKALTQTFQRVVFQARKGRYVPEE